MHVARATDCMRLPSATTMLLSGNHLGMFQDRAVSCLFAAHRCLKRQLGTFTAVDQFIGTDVSFTPRQVCGRPPASASLHLARKGSAKFKGANEATGLGFHPLR